MVKARAASDLPVGEIRKRTDQGERIRFAIAQRQRSAVLGI